MYSCRSTNNGPILPPVCYKAAPEVANRAFVYIKPHATSAKQLPNFIRNFFASKKIFRIVGEGLMRSKWKNDNFEKLYYRMYQISYNMKPKEHNLLPNEKEIFFVKHQIMWELAVEDNLVKNVTQACDFLLVDQAELCEIWAMCVKKNQVAKLNEALYCGLIDFVEDAEPFYCINGFFSAIRDEYVLYTAPLPYFFVEWPAEGNIDNNQVDSSYLTWDVFNDIIIGCENPGHARAESLRSAISANWESLQLPSPLDENNNAIHASASAFEALVERTQWLDAPTFSDPLGYSLNILGVTPSLLNEWFQNPVVKGKAVFDHFRDLGCKESIDVAYKLLLCECGCSMFYSHRSPLSCDYNISGNTAIDKGVSEEEISDYFHMGNSCCIF